MNKLIYKCVIEQRKMYHHWGKNQIRGGNSAPHYPLMFYYLHLLKRRRGLNLLFTLLLIISTSIYLTRVNRYPYIDQSSITDRTESHWIILSKGTSKWRQWCQSMCKWAYNLEYSLMALISDVNRISFLLSLRKDDPLIEKVGLPVHLFNLLFHKSCCSQICSPKLGLLWKYSRISYDTSIILIVSWV